MSIEKEKLIHRAPAFEGRMLHVFDDEVEIHGHKTTREVVLHPGASAIIPVTEDGEILFVRQYRYAVEQPLLEIPAGKLDGGEDPDTCAARELTEETGYKTEHMEKLGYVYTTPGFCNERIHLYLAQGLATGNCHPDEDEFVDTVRMPLEDAVTLVMDGTIRDGKTALGLMMASRLLASSQK